MNDKPLISIAIPTYNRANFLEKLLNNIVLQAKELKEGMIEICISNNCSTDNTREVVANFITKYPGIIKYNENKENIGFEGNLFEIIKMSEGNFIWTFGDDDTIISGGVKKVIDFIKNFCNENTGVVMLAQESYFINRATNKETAYFNTIEKNKPKMYKVDLNEVIGIRFNNSFISALLFNNIFIKKTIKEEQKIIKKAEEKDYIHTFIYQLMLLKHPELEIARLNKVIVKSPLRYYKFYAHEDEFRTFVVFRLFYVDRRKLNNLLLHNKYISDCCKKPIINELKKLKKSIIKEVGIAKAFDTFTHPFFSCIKLFFQQATFADALYMSFFLIIFYITPSFVLRELYKIFLKIKYKKEWQKIWFDIASKHIDMAKGNQGQVFLEDQNIN